MPGLPERARAYLDALEAERVAALTLSEQKAEEAKLIKARQDGFQAALKMLRAEISVEHDEAKPAGRRRGRRPIPQMILRELSFSGQAMSTAQIAAAIEYNRERTETVLKRLEKEGQVLRSQSGRWGIGTADLALVNGHAVSDGKGKSLEPPKRVASSKPSQPHIAF